jgi:hypothetical protein
LQFAFSPPVAWVAIGGGVWLQLGPSLLKVVTSVVRTTNSKARRAQRQRQSDRALSTLAKANLRLQSHHGSSAWMAPPSLATHWECFKCHSWAPRGGKGYCNSCGHAPPAGVTEKRSAPAKRAGAKPEAKTRAKAGGAGQDGKKKAAAADAKDRRIANLQKELAAAKDAAVLAQASPAAASGAGMCVDATNETEASALAQAVEKARDDVKHLEAFSQAQRALVLDFAALMASAKQKLEVAAEAKRAANPLRQRIDEAERFQKRAETRRTAAVAALDEHKQALAELQLLSAEKEEMVTTTDAEVAKAVACVASLVASLAAEKGALSFHSAAPCVQPQALAAGGEPTADYVLRTFAEDKWAEREKEVAAERAENQRVIAELRSLVADNTAADSAEAPSSEVAPSDVGSIDDLEEDSAWAKVDRSKRKTVLARQKQILAKQVRTTLGGIAKTKVMVVASPFQK